MNFQEIATEFKESAPGTDSFKRLYKSCFEIMLLDPSNASLYFVIGIASQAYVVRYEDQAISNEFAEKSKKTLDIFIDKILIALKSDNEQKILILNEITSHYQLNNNDF
ncbi:hypothetical protein AwWohl_10880 [Gammaproteobacteria bacterium]|nr:hypothetical protein AwWohl_10880 [Gammaproteobacteria bacterium]